MGCMMTWCSAVASGLACEPGSPTLASLRISVMSKRTTRIASRTASSSMASPASCVGYNYPLGSQSTADVAGAPAYFDGGLVEMKTLGSHKAGQKRRTHRQAAWVPCQVVSTRNNDFSNRSHKAPKLPSEP